MVALDLFPAILSCGLSGYAQTVLAEVLMQSYGPRKRERVFLGATEIHELTGLGRPNIRRAIRELVDAGILSQDGEYYRFQKDYEQWKPTPGPLSSRLGGTILEWIRGSAERLGPHKNSSKPTVSTQTHQTDVERVYLDTEGVSTQTQQNENTVSTQTHQTTVSCVYPDTPTHNIDCATRTPASEDKREERIKEIQDSPTPQLSNPKTETPIPGPEYTAVGNYAIDLTGDFSWGPWVDLMGKMGHPAESIRLAIDQSAGAGKLTKPYVASILKGWASSGGPPKPQTSNKPRSFGGQPEKLAPYQQPAVKQPFTDQFAASFAGVKK